MNTLLNHAKDNKWLFFFAPLFMFISVAADLIQPTLMARIVDIGVANRDLAYIWRISFLMIGSTLIGLLCGIISFYLSARSTAKTGERLRETLFDHILQLTHRELDQLSVPTLITRMTNDVSQVQNMLLAGQRILLRSPMLLFGGLVMAIALSPKLSIIFIFSAPLLAFCIYYILRRAARIYPVVQDKLDALNLITRETLLGIRVIKGYQSESQEKKRFSERNEGLFTWQLNAQKNNIILSPFIMIIFNYSMTAILWFGGYEAGMGQLEIGKIMAFVTYVSQILNAIMMSSFVLLMVSRAQTSLRRIEAVLETEPSVSDEKGMLQTPTSYEIKLSGVGFRYHQDGGEPILKNLSLDIAENERLGIIGPTGSGKSTLVSLMARLYDPFEGDITLGGVPLRKIPLKWLHQQIGLVQQNSVILSGSIEENLRISSPAATEENMKKALEQAMAGELVHLRKDGLLSGIQQRGTDLSGGQKQRLSIARVLLANPRILILDDSTSALDMITEQAFLDRLDEMRGRQTQIIIAQRISTLLRCDRIIVLSEGKIEAVGDHRQLLKDSSVYRTIAESQLGKEVSA